MRGGKLVPLKANVDAALDRGRARSTAVLVVRHLGNDDRDAGGPRPLVRTSSAPTVPDDCPCEPMNAEDPLVHPLHVGLDRQAQGRAAHHRRLCGVDRDHLPLCLRLRPGEIFWCTADVGWVTGHSYVVYGPLANGATSLMFEGVPNYPDFRRFWDVVERHKVDIFYTAPTAIRALMREGEAPVKKHDRSSIRLLGTVGEPINPEAWLWY